MKTITVGDLHGKDFWKSIDSSKYDKIVFVGDYVDAFYKTKADAISYGGIYDQKNGKDNTEILQCLNDVIEFKKQFPDKVVLLLGNHDNQYMFLNSPFRNKTSCSGFRLQISNELYKTFNDNKNLFQAAFQYKDYIWMHGGISNFSYKILYQSKLNKNDLTDWANEINRLFILNDKNLFAISMFRGGSDLISGIFWADIRETQNDSYIGLNQIVGHTKVKKIGTFHNGENTSITYVDCLDTIKEFYELDIL
jgi:predicted phosphodiesterase